MPVVMRMMVVGAWPFAPLLLQYVVGAAFRPSFRAGKRARTKQQSLFLSALLNVPKTQRRRRKIRLAMLDSIRSWIRTHSRFIRHWLSWSAKRKRKLRTVVTERVRGDTS